MSSLGLSLLPVAAPSLRLEDPRWEMLMNEARARFGVRTLRAGQHELVSAVLAGRDALGILPTGGGKSLAYQLPSLMLPRPVVVVSPLIALMKDQRDHVAAAGMQVVEMDSTIGARERAAGEAILGSGARCIVYTTPEHLQSESCIALLARRGVSLLAVDEAHCVSQWGHDFRPAYLRLASAARKLGRPPILALTATATLGVQTDIAAQLGLDHPLLVKPSVERRNLGLYVRRVLDEDDRKSRLCKLLAENPGSAIVYATTIKSCEALHAMLEQVFGASVARYHAQRSGHDRELARHRFMTGEARIMVATKAFGMGVDKPDVRTVIHAQLPDSLESYAQESGRAGRDGAPATAHLLHHPDDARIQRWFLATKAPARKDLLILLDAVALGPAQTTLETLAESAMMPRRKTEAVLAHLERLGAVTLEGHEVHRKIETRESSEIAALLEGYAARAAGDRARLAAMLAFTERHECRTAQLLGYFGEPTTGGCVRCDVCASLHIYPKGESTGIQYPQLTTKAGRS